MTRYAFIFAPLICPRRMPNTVFLPANQAETLLHLVLHLVLRLQQARGRAVPFE